MSIAIKNSTVKTSDTIVKNNLSIGIGSVDYEPTSISGFYSGVKIPDGGYVIYETNSSGDIKIYVANNTTELINIVKSFNREVVTLNDALYWLAINPEYAVLTQNLTPLNYNDIKLNFDFKNSLVYPGTGDNVYDLNGELALTNNVVKNFALPLPSWSTRRSDVTTITDGSIPPPFDGATVWSSRINASFPVNTLHRIWNDGSINGIVGTLGNGYYKYYLWVRGASTNTASATINIDISDGAVSSNVVVGQNTNWQKIEVWDNTPSNYNATKFFDFFTIGSVGDTFYISAIHIVAYDVPALQLTALNEFPGYIPYGGTKNVYRQATLRNTPSYTTLSGAFSFDGTNENLVTSASDFTANQDFTISLFAKSSNYLTTRGILANKNFWTTGQGVVIGNVSSPLTVFGYVNTSSGVYDINSGVGSTYDWTNFILRRSNNVLSMFVNGVAVPTTKTISGTITDQYNNFYVGSHQLASFWNGSVSDIKIYQRAFSDSEIGSLYYHGDITTDGLVFMIDPSNVVSYEPNATTIKSLVGTSTGTLFNGVAYNTIKDGSLLFDGTNDNMSFNSNANLNFLNTSPYTIEVWGNLQSLQTGARMMVSRENDIGSGRDGYNLILTNMTASTLTLAAERFSNGTQSGLSTTLSTNLVLQKWCHFLTTYDGTLYRLYLNGTLIATSPTPQTTNINNATTVLTIGSRGGGNYINMNIGATRIYNKALSLSEIEKNYKVGRIRFS